jgi:hypothetical protein
MAPASRAAVSRNDLEQLLAAYDALVGLAETIPCSCPEIAGPDDFTEADHRANDAAADRLRRQAGLPEA